MGLRDWVRSRLERRSSALGAGYVPPAPVLSGTYVTPQSALGLIAYFSAINVISRDLASLPIYIARRHAGGGREVDDSHPYHDLLGCETDGNTSALKFTLDTQGHVLGWGNSYVEVVRDRGVFVNTGRMFLEGFDYLYDALGGYVGYGWNRRLGSSQGGVTPGLSSAR